MKFGGREFVLPLELPLEFGQLWAEGKTWEGMQMLIEPDQWDAFKALRFTKDDLLALIEGFADVYGVQGNGSASGGGSNRASRRSRRPSGQRTG